jgi:cell wall assembly regulator SMI1
MREELQDTLSRLEWIHRDARFSFDRHPPATSGQLADAERQLGFEFTDELRELWLFSNGSNGGVWFCQRLEKSLGLGSRAFNLFSLDAALHRQSQFNEKWFEIWDGPPPGDPPGYRDPRIQPDFMHHQRWLNIGELPGGIDALRFDTIPTDQGRYGQIIAFQHDPDDILYVAPTIVSLLQQTCEILDALRQTNHPGFMSRLEYFETYRHESTELPE